MMYTREACPDLVAELREFAVEQKAETGFIERIVPPRKSPPYFHMDSQKGPEWRLYEKADLLSDICTRRDVAHRIRLATLPTSRRP